MFGFTIHLRRTKMDDVVYISGLLGTLPDVKLCNFKVAAQLVHLGRMPLLHESHKLVEVLPVLDRASISLCKAYLEPLHLLPSLLLVDIMRIQTPAHHLHRCVMQLVEVLAILNQLLLKLEESLVVSAKPAFEILVKDVELGAQLFEIPRQRLHILRVLVEASLVMGDFFDCPLMRLLQGTQASAQPIPGCIDLDKARPVLVFIALDQGDRVSRICQFLAEPVDGLLQDWEFVLNLGNPAISNLLDCLFQ
mmetsp:Transcript_14226/g.25142  ORF Transcript_14226/g.25142 Transcript_14226/m.25142 type:complete len:250 (+) Transcript_14226:888-1637(+)